MVIGSYNRWLFAFLFLFTASNFECLIRKPTSGSSGGSFLFAAAQDKPSFTTPQFSNITHRTFVCDRFIQYANGTTNIRDLLEGLDLSVGIVDQGNDIYLRLNRSDPDPNNWSINENDPGIFVKILDELASRGKFSWRKSFAFVQPPRTFDVNPTTGTNFTWTDVLLDAVTRYDFSFAEWVHNQERRRLGISFPVGWFDASTILVQNKVEQVSTFNVAAFLRPFSVGVWYLSCAVIFFSGIVWWALDKIEFPDDKINTVVFDTFFTTLTITQHHMYENPHTVAKRIFSFSLALWSLILAAAYTANLASYLVAEQRPLVLADTLQGVDEGRLPLCVRSGAAVYGQVSRAFEGIDFRPQDSFDAVYESLRAGRCDLMASRKADFDAFKNDRFKNPNCSLEWVGRVQFINKGGPGTLVDTSNFCTSVIRHVLDVHLHEMISDGTIDFLWNTHLRNLDNIQLCGGTKLDDVEVVDPKYSLQANDVGGVFVFHGVMILISFIVTLCESPWRRKRHAKRKLREAQREAMEANYSEYEEEVIEKPRPSMERLASCSGRPSMERLASSYGRPSMERYASAKSLVYCGDFDDSNRSEGDEIYETDGLLRSIQRMQTKIDRLQRHVKRKIEEKNGEVSTSFASKALRSLPVIADVIDEDESPSEEASLEKIVSTEEESKIGQIIEGKIM
ncbi:unnamed protein product [Cylindrotheca closterium]|uniref:Ionotropic glutamate receptor C-terminal domain-containing protein n=1 Tax=Cylindrotheca closterium TaxID=2856 RepID=A0AAD2JK28_9STRA|nr:unnamed protein product [Cylindrotheca closterium]